MEPTSSTETAATGVPGPNKRVFAFLIDGIAYSAALALLEMLFPQIRNSGQYLLWAVYFLLRDVAGRSLGKRLTGLTVVNGAGQPAGTASLIIRNVPIAIPFVVIVEYVVMRQSSDARRLGDRWANTRVRDERPGVNDGRYLAYSIALIVVLALMTAFANRLAQAQAFGLAEDKGGRSGPAVFLAARFR